jgi:GNAT superfamily N-acetyltransferase
MALMREHVDVSISESLSPQRLPELMALYAGQWWTKGRQRDDVIRMLDHSDLIATASDGSTDRLLGFARVITDFTYVAYLLDVIVDEGSRGSGVGALLLDALVAHPALQEVRSLELVCQQELEGFYARWGFTSRVGGSRLMRRTADPLLRSD